MPVLRSYQCPDCTATFEYMHMRLDEPPPLVCGVCGGDMRDTQPELSAPHIARTIGKVADNVYRAMEDASVHQAELAAEALGESVSDMSVMKLTNLRDDTRPGEIAAVQSNNAVSNFMTQTRIGGHADAATAQEYARQTRIGPHAGAGVAAMEKIKSQHARVLPGVISQGNQGRY